MWNGKEGLLLVTLSGDASSVTAAEAEAEAESAAEEGEAGAAAAEPAAGAGDLRAAEGSMLQASLRRAVGEHLGGGPLPPVDVGLAQLGLDSLTLAQLQSRLEAEYGLRVADEAMFADETTISWLVRSAAPLRGLAPWPEPEQVRAQEAQVAPVAEVELVGAGADADAGAAGGALPRRARRQPSVVEVNCPCFLLCCG